MILNDRPPPIDPTKHSTLNYDKDGAAIYFTIKTESTLLLIIYEQYVDNLETSTLHLHMYNVPKFTPKALQTNLGVKA